MFDYDARIFRPVANSEGGDVNGETKFHYHQRDNIVWATYAGGSVVFGTLLAKVDASGNMDMRYQHVSVDGNFKSGHCQSRPETLPDGRVRLHEQWEWTDGAEGQGVSIIEEIRANENSLPALVLLATHLRHVALTGSCLCQIKLSRPQRSRTPRT